MQAGVDGKRSTIDGLVNDVGRWLDGYADCDRNNRVSNNQKKELESLRGVWKYYGHLKNENSRLTSKIDEIRSGLGIKQSSLTDEGEFVPHNQHYQESSTVNKNKINKKSNSASIFEVEISVLKAKIASVQAEIDKTRHMTLETNKALEDITANKTRVIEVISTMKAERQCLNDEISRLQGILSSIHASHGQLDADRLDGHGDSSIDVLERDQLELRAQTDQLTEMYGDKCGDLVDYFIGSIEQ